MLFRIADCLLICCVLTQANGEFLSLNDDGDSANESDVESGMLVNEDNDSYLDDEILFEEHLLDGLSKWLERLFKDGTIKYRINYWPEHMK